MIGIPKCDLILPDRPLHDPAYGRPGMHLEYTALPMTEPSSIEPGSLIEDGTALFLLEIGSGLIKLLFWLG
jgi:hypothetical protein